MRSVKNITVAVEPELYRAGGTDPIDRSKPL
jgi:hypothetical protein